MHSSGTPPPNQGTRRTPSVQQQPHRFLERNVGGVETTTVHDSNAGHRPPTYLPRFPQAEISKEMGLRRFQEQGGGEEGGGGAVAGRRAGGAGRRGRRAAGPQHRRLHDGDHVFLVEKVRRLCLVGYTLLFSCTDVTFLFPRGLNNTWLTRYRRALSRSVRKALLRMDGSCV